MSMTRQHFVAIAAALKSAKPPKTEVVSNQLMEQWRLDTRYITAALSRFNSGFDRARFLAACGYED